jgi:hypothetical protein
MASRFTFTRWLLCGGMLLGATACAQRAEPGAVSPAPPETWSGRPSRTWELSAGVDLGYRTYKVAPKDTRGTGVAGGSISGGFRRLVPYDSDNAVAGLADAHPTSAFDGWVWCAPVACFGIGLLFMPVSSFVGNERGADLRLHLTRDFMAGAEGLRFSAGLRPVFRVSVEGSRLRSASLLGAFLPEMGVELSAAGSRALYFELSPFPISLYLNRWAAITWDLALLRVMVPLGDSTATGRFATGLSFVLP